jgi:hypothetical protein
MDSDSDIVLLDGFAIVTRTEASISLKYGREIPYHARRGVNGLMRTYDFLVFFCVDASSLHTFCAFHSPRLKQFFLVGYLCRAHATGFCRYLKAINNVDCVSLKATSFRERVGEQKRRWSKEDLSDGWLCCVPSLVDHTRPN